MYTRDTLSHAHTPDPPCSSASSASSHFSPSWRPGAAPACSSPCLGIGLNPASSGRDASAPTPRHLRAPSVPSAVLLSPHSPNLRRRSAKKSAQAVSGQPEPPYGGSGWPETASPFTPHPFPLPPRRATQPPAQTSPHRPATTSPTRATPRSARRRACPGASPTQPKTAPPRLKSFLEKTLIAREAPISPHSACARLPRRSTTRGPAITTSVVETLAGLVAINSVNSSLEGGPGEAELANHVADLARAAGADVEMYDVEPGRPNLLAWIRRGARPTLMFECHLDTVGLDPMPDALNPRDRQRPALRSRLGRSQGLPGRHAARPPSGGGGPQTSPWTSAWPAPWAKRL